MKIDKHVILMGEGCRGNQALIDWLCGLGVPVLTTWQAIDLVPDDLPVFCGRPGNIGQRGANIVQQKADALWVFGARLDNEQVGWRMDNFAPHAEVHVFDVDDAEFGKMPEHWSKVCVDLRVFSPPAALGIKADLQWLDFSKRLYQRYQNEALHYYQYLSARVDPYAFADALSDACDEGEVIVPASSGMQSCAMMQSFRVKRGQRIMLCNTIGAMGMEPMAIGAALASGKRVVVVAGDGGFFLNVQELEVVKRLNLPIKYFVFSNDGYASISAMQDARFGGLRVGSDAESGFTVPSVGRTALLFGMNYHVMYCHDNLSHLREVLAEPGPCITQVVSTLNFRYACRVGSSLQGDRFVVDAMEDMTPKLDAAELKGLMQWGT